MHVLDPTNLCGNVNVAVNVNVNVTVNVSVVRG